MGPNVAGKIHRPGVSNGPVGWSKRLGSAFSTRRLKDSTTSINQRQAHRRQRAEPPASRRLASAFSTMRLKHSTQPPTYRPEHAGSARPLAHPTPLRPGRPARSVPNGCRGSRGAPYGTERGAEGPSIGCEQRSGWLENEVVEQIQHQAAERLRHLHQPAPSSPAPARRAADFALTDAAR